MAVPTNILALNAAVDAARAASGAEDLQSLPVKYDRSRAAAERPQRRSS
ncbi:hypothetical protein [Paraburkholderia youngii]